MCNPISLEQLPLTNICRFLESLSTKSHSAPLSVDRVSELYQNFYVHAESNIATHVAALSTRISREKSPTPSTSSISSNTSKGGSRKGSKRRDTGDDLGSEQQMLTATEITDRRKTRRQLELKKIALEEAVERGVCEKVYMRLWRHRSTDDEARDEKLRSRAAALSVVGVDLKELLSTAMEGEDDATNTEIPGSVQKAENPARKQLAEARSSLEQMNSDRCPRGKLQHLVEAHKIIVETLSEMFPSSSSADEILPTLIYIIITTPPETINVISNFNFIQRFRAANKMDGEAAYCLTNLEAAISFLETVDLSSIRPEEAQDGSHKQSSRPSTPRSDTSNPMYRGFPVASPDPEERTSDQQSASPGHSRRLSNLLGSTPKPLEAASGAMLTGADSAIDAMHNALDGSFKFLFGRLREKQATHSPDGSTEVTVPKTLEDARKLVNSPSVAREDDHSLGEEEALTAENSSGSPAAKDSGDSRMLELVGGRRIPTRERSVDSTGSTGSGKKVAFAEKTPSKLNTAESAAESESNAPSNGTPATANSTNPASSQPPGYTAVESMRTFGNSINPLKGFSMRGFGRTVSNPGSNSSSVPTIAAVTGGTNAGAAETADGVGESKPATGLGVDLSGVGPPIRRFLECKEAKELNGFDVELLLRDYQRLSGALRALKSPQ